MTTPTVQANIEVHTQLAASYDQVEPHFRPENRARVRTIVAELRTKCGGGRLLDLGCGTGFLIGLSRDLFEEIHGIDVTQAMLDRVDRSSGNITLHRGLAETVPLPDNYFDMVTAYSFLHHTEDCRKIMHEAYRLLKPGGIFYADQDPNRLFWTWVQRLKGHDRAGLSPLVAQAHDAVLQAETVVEQRFGTPKELMRQAEPMKAELGGLDPAEVKHDANRIGFRNCEVVLEWFLGQAEVIHRDSIEKADQIADYLRSVSPLADHLFKYLRFVLTK